jgi:Na+-driven multidrug efflux pump
MIKLALPGMIMIEAQFSVLEILTIAAGRFGTAQLAAQGVLVTLTSTSFNIPFPLAIATSTRVANLIGANLSQAARVTAKVVRSHNWLIEMHFTDCTGHRCRSSRWSVQLDHLRHSPKTTSSYFHRQ